MNQASQYPDGHGINRTVRSFVLRGGRLTEGQKRALEELWPRYGVDMHRGLLDFASLFGNVRPVVLEIGFGNGEATWRMAQSSPEQNFLAVDVHRPGIGRLLLNLEKHRVHNVRVACGDAVELLQKCIAERSLDAVRIFFPDPWPKKRHHKRRMIQPPFVKTIATRLKPGAILHLATDWQPYAEHMLAVMRARPEFTNLSPGGDYCERPEWRAATKYENRGTRLGHQVRDLLFERSG